MWKYLISFVLEYKEAQGGSPQGGPYAVELPIFPLWAFFCFIKKKKKKKKKKQGEGSVRVGVSKTFFSFPLFVFNVF